MNDSFDFLNEWKFILIDRNNYLNHVYTPDEIDKTPLIKNEWNHFISLIRNEFVNCICPGSTDNFVEFLSNKNLDVIPKLTPTSFNMIIVRCSSYIHMAEKNISLMKETSLDAASNIQTSYLSNSYLSEIKLLTDFLFDGKTIKEFMDTLYDKNLDDISKIDDIITQEVQNFLAKYVM